MRIQEREQGFWEFAGSRSLGAVTGQLYVIAGRGGKAEPEPWPWPVLYKDRHHGPTFPLTFTFTFTTERELSTEYGRRSTASTY